MVVFTMTKMNTANRMNEIAPSGIRAMFDRAQGIPGVISLGIGQPNIPTPKGLVQALVNAVEGGDNYYSPTIGTAKYREAVAEQNKRWYNLDYNSSTDILATASGSSYHSFARSISASEASTSISSLNAIFLIISSICSGKASHPKWQQTQ